MGLNADFKRDPVAFLSRCWDINSSENLTCTYYGLNDKKIGNFDLTQYSAETVRLVPAGGGLFGQSAIKAYYLPSRVDSDKAMSLGSEADYFFTDAITGCQFCAYGERTRPTVCHNNHLSDGSKYDAPAALVRSLTATLKIVFGQAEYQQGLLPTDRAGDVLCTVIGWRKADGWHFYAKRRINNPQDLGGRRALDTAAFELT